jgi:hypothetical protein
VIAAVEALRAEGSEFDFVLLEGLPHGALLLELAEADIVIDQIVIGWYGVLAVEAMALGKAVVAYIRDDLVHEVPQGVLFNANPKTITERLRELVSSADLRAELGQTARRYVEAYHASEVVAAKLDAMYRELKQAPAREASMKLFANNFENTLQLMAHEKRVADAKAKAKAEANAAAKASVAAKAPAAAKAPVAATAPAAAKASVAAKAPAAIQAVATAKTLPAKVLAPRTLWQRVAHASLAKAIHRVKRIAGRS